MKTRGSTALCQLPESVITFNVQSWGVISVEIGSHLGRSQDPLAQAYGAEQGLPVALLGQIIWLNHRSIFWFRASRPDIALAFGTHLPDARGHTG